MKAIVIADTHLKAPEKLAWLTSKHTDAGVIIHAGDYTGSSVLTFLQSQGPFFGAAGNADPEAIKLLLPEKQVLTLGSYQVGLYHGHGPGGTTPARAFRAFAGEQVDIIIFGHSHQPCIFTRSKILMLNPGSLTTKRQERWFSYIVLTLAPTGPTAQLIFDSRGRFS
ncbi:metallophosphoesterase family protein [Sporomusa termitida]|uniref:Phosphoesterase n=1 Tax=Sporomusa termitida TaxID=2377 RepID=A0A517DWI7_9FIRM|nr:metallophosphoesterase [Sporomusa termitida]QDR81712.1 yfcE: phosphodieSPTERase [Sporomusa termitida]